MRLRPSSVRRASALAGVLFVTAACGSGAPGAGAPATSGSPSLSAVSDGRYVRSIALGSGALSVVPPPSKVRVAVSRGAAMLMFDSTDVAAAAVGEYEYSVFGLGVATLSTPAEHPSTTTTPSSAAGAAGGSSTTMPSTTSGSLGEPSTVAGAVTSGALPRYVARLAWIGILWGQVPPCPDTPGVVSGASGAAPAAAPAPASSATSSSVAKRRRAHPVAEERYVVVLVAANDDRDTVTYTSAGPVTCGGSVQPAALSRPVELESVPWQPVGPASTAVVVALPPCATYFGWTQLATAGSPVQIVAAVPIVPTCSAPVTHGQIVDDVVPLGGGPPPHAPLGPVPAWHALTGSS